MIIPLAAVIMVENLMKKDKMKTRIIHPSQISGILDGSIKMLREPAPCKLRYCEDHDAWYDDHLMEHKPPYQIGDIVTGLEEWFKLINLGKTYILYKYSFNKDYPDWRFDPVDWQPADTMPEDFSRIKYKVLDVGVQMLGEIDIEVDKDIGSKYCNRHSEGIPYIYAKEARELSRQKYWNTLHPNHPYREDLWTFWQRIERIEGDE